MSQYNYSQQPQQQINSSYTQPQAISSYTQQDYLSPNQPTQELSNTRINKSFIDNKPMIQGLVRSVLKVEKSG